MRQRWEDRQYGQVLSEHGHTTICIESDGHRRSPRGKRKVLTIAASV